MKESQARALEELAKKHRVTLENALNSAEMDKNHLLTVSTYIHPIYLSFYLCGDYKDYIIYCPAAYPYPNHPI